MITSYEDLEIYQQSYKLSLEIHKITQKYPEYERYEIGSQLRRAAISIPLNIAEGYGKKDSAAEFKRFLNIAQGSSNEMKVLVSISKDLGYIDSEMYEKIAESYTALGKRINTLLKNWKQF